MNIERIMIIGGGIGGLCLAHGLKRAGIPFELFERGDAVEARGQGYRLRIDAAGQDALARCLPVDLLYLLYQSATYANAEPWCINGNIEAMPMPTPESWAGPETTLPDLCVHRQTLREILLCGIAGHVHFNCRLQDFAERNGGVIARFANGRQEEGSVLVGADGAGSVVRSQLLPSAIPQETDYVCIYGRTPATPQNCRAVGRDLCAGTSVVQADGFTAIIDVMTFRERMQVLASRIAPDCRLSAVDDYFYWALTGPRDRLGVAALPRTPADLGQIVGHLIRGWAPPLQALFLRGDPAEWAVHPIRSLVPDHSGCSDRVTLLGDAIHVMSPAGGLGASTALQDAADLARHLDRARKEGRMLHGLRRYETEMRERAIAAVQSSLAGSARLAGAMAA